MINKTNTLLLFTQSYPFGKEETFLEEEIKVLKDNFETIYILSSSNDEKTRDVPANVKEVKIPFTKLTLKKILHAFLNKYYWRELFITMKKKPFRIFSSGFQKTLIYSLANSISLSMKIDSFIKGNINTENTKLFFYSYWINDFALSFIHLKNKINGIYLSRGHGWDIYLERSAINYLPLRSILPKYLDSLYFISEKGCQYYKNNFFNSEKLKSSRLGVSNVISHQKFIHKKRITLVSCSLIVPVKRIDLLVQSLALLQDIEYIWYHIGYDPHQGGLKNQINKLAKNLNVNLNMVGFLSNEDVHQFYHDNEIDLFLNLSSSEGIPVSIMEAFSFSIPAMATNVGGTSEIVSHENGYLLEANPTSEMVAKSINLFYNLSIEEKNNKRKMAYKIWSEKYNAKKNYTQFAEDILSL